MATRRTLHPLVMATALLAACSSPEHSERSGATLAGDVAAVSTQDAARTEHATPESTNRTPEPSGSTTRATPPAGPRDVHAERERMIEEAAEEDRAPGGAEARIEADGSVYKPGVGVLPRYTVRTIDKKDGPPPDASVMRFVPGSNIELPAPQAKPPEEIPGKEIIVPREAK